MTTPQHLYDLPVEQRLATVRNLTPSPREHRLTIKTDPILKVRFSSTGQLWDELKLNSPNRVGGVMDIIKKHIPNTPEEWEQLYFTHGKPLTRLQATAARLHLKSSPLISLQEAIDFTFIRVIDETWAGFELEKLTHDLLLASGLFDVVRWATKFEDNQYGVDLICLRNGVVVLGVQVKTDAYYRMAANHKAKLENQRRNQRFLAQHPQAEVQYVVKSDIEKGELLWVDKSHYAYKPLELKAA